VVSSDSWNQSRGAVTWRSGTSGVSGVVSSSNSLVGSTSGDRVGDGDIKALGNGNYLVGSSDWGDGRGAVTWGGGTSGVSGVVSNTNSLVGSNPGTHYGFISDGEGFISGITELAGGRFLINSPAEQNGAGKLELVNSVSPFGFTGTLAFSTSPRTELLITPAQIAAIATAGTHVILQANNDITLAAASDIRLPVPSFAAVANGDLILRAGRSIELSSNIATGGSHLTLWANDAGADLSYRDSGVATIVMAPGTSIDLTGAPGSAGSLEMRHFADVSLPEGDIQTGGLNLQ